MNTKVLAEKWFDGVWNQKNPSVITEMMDPLAAGTTEAGEINGPDEFRTKMFEPFLQAFPDVRVTVDQVIADGDEAAIRWTAHATHKGPLIHLPATNRQVVFNGISWLRFRDGKIIGGSDSYNFHGLVAYLSGGNECASVRGRSTN